MHSASLDPLWNISDCKSRFNASVSYIPNKEPGHDHAGMEKWHDRAKAALRERGLTQGDLAEHFEMTPAGMQKWLSGKHQPSLEDLVRIADFIGMPRAELLLGKEEPTSLQGFPPYAAEPLQLMMDGAKSGKLDANWFRALALAGQLLDQARGLEGGSSAFATYLSSKEPPLSSDALHLAREYDKVTDESQRKMVFSQTEHLLRYLGRTGDAPQADTKARPSRRTN